MKSRPGEHDEYVKQAIKELGSNVTTKDVRVKASALKGQEIPNSSVDSVLRRLAEEGLVTYVTIRVDTYNRTKWSWKGNVALGDFGGEAA